MRHDLKTIQPYFNDVRTGVKCFELRKDDRGFAVGDVLNLAEYVNGALTGAVITAKVIYLLRDAPQFGLMPGYVILGIEKLAVFPPGTFTRDGGK